MNYTAATLEVLNFPGQCPEGSYYVREVAEGARVGSGAASITLRALSAQGLVGMEEKGGMKLYPVDLSNPVSRQFKVLFTVLALKDLVEMLREDADRDMEDPWVLTRAFQTSQDLRITSYDAGHVTWAAF